MGPVEPLPQEAGAGQDRYPVAPTSVVVAWAESAAPWHSPSLTVNTATAPNGALTTTPAPKANALWGFTEAKVAEKGCNVLYALRGWGSHESRDRNRSTTTGVSVKSGFY